MVEKPGGLWDRELQSCERTVESVRPETERARDRKEEKRRGGDRIELTWLSLTREKRTEKFAGEK